MFKRSRKKIILAIMGSLVLLFAITLSVILLASYREIRQENMAMLKRHVELYYLDSETGGPAVPPDSSGTVTAPHTYSVREDGTWTCPTCGYSENKGRFCAECGSRRPEQR